MPYINIAEAEFEGMYRTLAEFLKYHENQSLDITLMLFNNLADTHPLKTKSFFVLNRENGKAFLHKAAAQEQVRMIQFLMSKGHTVNLQDHQSKTPLYDACAELKLGSVNVLLSYDADPNLGDVPANVIRVSTQELREKKFFQRGEKVPLVATIESQTLVTTLNHQATYVAFRSEFGEDLSLMPPRQATEIIAAIIVRKLINKNAFFNLQSGPHFLSALNRAILAKKNIIVREIVNFDNVDFCSTTIDGEAALHLVVDYRTIEDKEFEQIEMLKEKEITELIIPHLEAINIQEFKYGNTPLHAAVIKSNWAVVKAIYEMDYLFTHLKLLNIQNSEGNTVMHEAVKAAKRGPKVLALLLRVATEDDMAIINNAGETPRQMAERLINSAMHIGDLSDNLKTAAETFLNDNLEFEQLKTALNELRDDEYFEREVSSELSNEVETLWNKLLTINQQAIDLVDLQVQVESIARGMHDEFFYDDYFQTLKTVNGEAYSAWKMQKLELPSSFPELNNPGIPEEKYYTDLRHANECFERAQQIVLQAMSDQAMSDHWSEFESNINQAISLYSELKAYANLENAYQMLAKGYVSTNNIETITNYEKWGQTKLALNNQEKLQGHFALAGLYNDLKNNELILPFYSVEELKAHESFHYYEAYKLTQGDLDSEAYVVLQREIGIAENAKLGTYNIQQCVAVVAFDPLTNKVILSHFDKFSGPLSFIDQLLAEFPRENTIDLYLSGGRDRFSLATNSNTRISDNNIDQVLKQIYAEQHRFNVKSCDVGDNVSPEAIVFDMQSKKLIHATPNLEDSSLASREVKFQFQWIKDDYLHPLNRVDLNQHPVDRTITFSLLEQLEIMHRYDTFEKIAGQTEAWNHLIFFPLLEINNELHRQEKPNFSQGLFQREAMHRYVEPLPIDEDLNVIPENNDLSQVEDKPMEVYEQEHNINLGQLFAKALQCINNRRRKRDADCVLDSEVLLNQLEDATETEQSKVLQRVATRLIGGTKQKEVTQLLHNQKINTHLQQVGKFSSALTDKLFSAEAVIDLFKGDPSAAINLGGLKLVGHVLGKTSQVLDEVGKGFLAEGKLFRAKVLRASTPFVSRGTTLLVGFDLYNQIVTLQKDGNNTDALVQVVSDGVLITTGLLGAGIETLELTSEAIAVLGVSSALGPAGEIIDAIAILGDRVYEAVETVAKEKHDVHLTAWETFKEGILAFSGQGPERYIKKMMDEVNEYERTLLKKLEFLKSHPAIKHVIFPAIEKIGDSCRDNRVKIYPNCREDVIYSPPRAAPFFLQRICYITRTTCEPIFAKSKNNSVYFAHKQVNFKLTREIITPPLGSELLCVPSAEKGQSGEALSFDGAYRCDSAIGLTNTNSTAGTVAFYDLGEGEDHAVGFNDGIIKNYFKVKNGAKDYVGGKTDDVFMLEASQVINAANLDGGIGGLNGKEGVDTLLLPRFLPPTDEIKVNFKQGSLNYGNKNLAITSIEKLVGGAVPISVTVACGTQEVDTGGGLSVKHADSILIPNDTRCDDRNLKMHLKPTTVVKNQALQGNFTYFIHPGIGEIVVNLAAVKSSESEALISDRLKHQFVLNTEITGVAAFSLAKKTISFHFTDHKTRKFLRNLESISINKSNSISNITLDYQLKSNALQEMDHLSALPMTLNQDQAKKMLKYPIINFESDSFNVILRNRHQIRHLILNLLENTDPKIVEDFKLRINDASSNSMFLDNLHMKFIDGAVLVLKPGNKHSYLFQTTDQSINQVIHHYLPIVRRLNITCSINTLQNQRVIMSHNGAEVVPLDSNVAETHFINNGLIVIDSKNPLSQLPLNPVVLHAMDNSHIVTLDFRRLNEKIQREFNATPKFIFVTPNAENNLGNDLMLRLTVHSQSKPENKPMDVISVRLIDGWLNHWYKAHLHLVLQVAPQRITGSPLNLHLKPIPLVLNERYDLTVIGVNDVERDTDIIIPSVSNHGHFFHHNKTNLIWTNTLSPSEETVKPFSIILLNFFTEPDLSTLTLEFIDKKLMLCHKLTEINAAANFEQASDARKKVINKQSLAIMASKRLLSEESQPTITVDGVQVGSSIDSSINTDTKTFEVVDVMPKSSRRRRFVESQVFDPLEEKANLYYDQYDRRKEKQLRAKTSTLKSKGRLTTQANQQRVEHHHKPAMIVSDKHINKTVTQSTPVAHNTHFFAQTTKATYSAKSAQVTSFAVQRNRRFNQQSLFIKPSQIKTNPVIGKASRVKAISNQAANYFQPPAARALIAGRQSLHQQRVNSAPGLSRVSELVNVNQQLFLANFLMRCMTKVKYGTPCTLPSAIARYQRTPAIELQRPLLRGHLKP